MATKNTTKAAMDRFIEDQTNRLRFAAYEIAQHLEEYAQQHHKWTPITNITDITTRGTVSETADTIWIILSSNSGHAKYLELARNGKWAWLRPAIINNRDYILATIKKHCQVKVNPVIFEAEGDF